MGGYIYWSVQYRPGLSSNGNAGNAQSPENGAAQAFEFNAALESSGPVGDYGSHAAASTTALLAASPLHLHAAGHGSS